MRYLGLQRPEANWVRKEPQEVEIYVKAQEEKLEIAS